MRRNVLDVLGYDNFSASLRTSDFYAGGISETCEIRDEAADCGEYREVAGVVAEVLNEPETKRKKAALAALVFEDWNGPTSSQRTVPVKRLKHIEAVETR